MIFSKTPEIKLCTLCVQSNSATLQVHLYRYIVVEHPPKLDDCKSWDYLASWTNRDFPNPKNAVLCQCLVILCMWIHACVRLYYLGLKEWSLYLKMEINYSSKITTHIIYIHIILQISRYQNQTIDQITICIPPDKITTVT